MAQFLLSPLLLWRSFVATVLSNALYGLAFSYYHYITFLGYSSLPFLSDTVVRSCCLRVTTPPALRGYCPIGAGPQRHKLGVTLSSTCAAAPFVPSPGDVKH